MKGSRTAKPSTLHQRSYRERMRQQGLVKKDVWIRPEHATDLAAIERSMRASSEGWMAPEAIASAAGQGQAQAWTTQSLHQALSSAVPAGDNAGPGDGRGPGMISIEWIEGAEPGVCLLMHAYGDLPVFVVAGAEQVVVEAYLWPLSAVADPAAFNALVLRTHRLLPLTTISIQVIAGEPAYIMSGALDSRSGLASLWFEIETLADNVINATEAYAGYLLDADVDDADADDRGQR